AAGRRHSYAPSADAARWSPITRYAPFGTVTSGRQRGDRGSVLQSEDPGVNGRSSKMYGSSSGAPLTSSLPSASQHETVWPGPAMTRLIRVCEPDGPKPVTSPTHRKAPFTGPSSADESGPQVSSASNTTMSPVPGSDPTNASRFTSTRSPGRSVCSIEPDGT